MSLSSNSKGEPEGQADGSRGAEGEGVHGSSSREGVIVDLGGEEGRGVNGPA